MGYFRARRAGPDRRAGGPVAAHRHPVAGCTGHCRSPDFPAVRRTGPGFHAVHGGNPVRRDPNFRDDAFETRPARSPALRGLGA